MVRFKFRDSGQTWEIEDSVYQLLSGTYYKNALRDMKWFRHYFQEVCSDIVSVCEVFRGHELISTIYVGDYFIAMQTESREHMSYCIWERSVKDE